MLPSPLQRPALACAALALAFASGAVTATWLSPREARAQGSASSIQVPREGLTFRTAEGRPVARLSYDARGGTFEVLDEHGTAVSAMGPGTRMGPGTSLLRENAPLSKPPSDAWSLDEVRDPWARSATPRSDRDDYANFGERR